MPSVPSYDSFQVQARPLPGVRQESNVSPGMLATGDDQIRLGQGLQRAGAGLGELALKMQDRQNADMMFRAETALQTDFLEYKASASERRGQNAWNITKDTATWFDKKASEHEGNLENDAQRMLFRQQATKLRTQALGYFSAFETEQRRVSLGESAQASIVGATNLAASAAADAPRGAPTEGGFVQAFDVSAHKADIIKRVQALSAMNGWSPELRAAKESEHLTNFHKQIIQARLDADPAGAKAYFEANKGEIAGSQHDLITKALKVGGIKETAQSFADQAEATGLDETDALKAAREKYSGEEEAAVVQELKVRFGERSRIREQGQKDASDAAWQAFSKRGRLSDIPAATLAAMDGRDLETLRTHARVVSEGHAVKTDPNTYLDLREMARENPQAFRQLDLRRYIGKLSGGDIQEFSKLQGSVEKIKDAATLDAQLGNTHDQLGWGAGDREKKGAFDKKVADFINDEQQRRGKALDYTERQRIIDRMAISGEVLSGSVFLPDPNKKYYEVAGTPDAAKFAPEISDADRASIVERYQKKKGRKPSNAEVLQTYKTWKGL